MMSMEAPTNYITQQAFERGRQHGDCDKADGLPKNDAPLSGEWAGESIVELIGDLIENAESDEHCHEICEAYEDGYSLGYDDATVYLFGLMARKG
jgi:hypothetical protein